MKTFKKISTISLLIMLSLSMVPTTHAGFSLIPSNAEERRQFNFEINPGESKSDQMIIQNFDQKPLTLLLYGADATHSNQGSFALVNRTAQQRTLGQWIKFDQETITLNPNEKKSVKFTINLPTKTPPGNYGGGIAAETTSVEQQNGINPSNGAGVVVSSRLVLKVFVSVPGDRKTSYEWTSFNHQVNVNNEDRFNFEFKNEGNTAITIEPEIEMSGFPGIRSGMAIQKIAPTSMIQADTIKVPYAWHWGKNTEETERPWFGLYTAKAKVIISEYDIANDKNINPKVIEKSVTFVIIPWTLLLILLLFFGTIGAIFGVQKFQINNLKKTAESYTVEENETVVSIAEKKGTDWKKIAQLNNLKAPYNIQKGQTLLIPKNNKKQV